ncbi:MAG: MopE-related protein [Myxococcota bacterium]|nr:MopE-related protein [Myxococcota bacterium]
MNILLLFLSMGCPNTWVMEKSSDTALTDDDTSSESEESTETEPATEPSGEPTEEPTQEPESEPDPLDVDDDGDGWTENEGDCDDDDEDVSPYEYEIPYDGIDNDCNPYTPDDDLDEDGVGLYDGDCDDEDPDRYPGNSDDNCDEIDNNCDGYVDEGFALDAYEDNDMPTDAYPLGSLEDDNDGLIELEAYIVPDAESDFYTFHVEDSWFDNFSFEMEVSNTPLAVNIAMRLYFQEEDGSFTEVDSVDNNSVGDDESMSYGGWPGLDSTGWYVLEVYSTTGSNCDSTYHLRIED